MTGSVVITTKNRKDELPKTVESAMTQLDLLEVIVIDDGSTDGTAEVLKKRFLDAGVNISEENPATDVLPPARTDFPFLRLVRHEVSKGYIVRRNEGARLAKGDIIFSLDDDAVFSSPLVVAQTLADFSHPRIGAVAIPYIEPHKGNSEMQRAPSRDAVWITASFVGTAHAVRRDLFLELGGYREHLVHQGEEKDFCIRMMAATWEDKAEKLKKGEIIKGSNTDEREGNIGAGKVQHRSPLSRSSILDSATLSAVPGFFVRMGNSDPIIHNESPKRDYSRMDFYGRRNDVLFHWQNTPFPDILWQMPMTVIGGLVCAAKVGRWRNMLKGIRAGFWTIVEVIKREPVSRKVFRFRKRLRK